MHGNDSWIQERKCTICIKFLQDFNSFVHIASVHEGKRPFECDKCEKRFAMKGQMTKHISSVHEGNKPYKCTHCKYGFPSKAKWKGHIKSVSHFGEI